MRRKQPPATAPPKLTPKPKTKPKPISRLEFETLHDSVDTLTHDIRSLNSYIAQVLEKARSQKKSDNEELVRGIALTMDPIMKAAEAQKLLIITSGREFREAVNHMTQEANRSAIAEGSMKADNKATRDRIDAMSLSIASHQHLITEAARTFRNTIDRWVPAGKSSFPVWLEGIEKQISELSIKDGAIYRILHDIANGRKKECPAPPTWMSEDDPECSRDVESPS